MVHWNADAFLVVLTSLEVVSCGQEELCRLSKSVSGGSQQLVNLHENVAGRV